MGALGPLLVEANAPGGGFSALNLSTPTVIRGAPNGTLLSISVINVGTDGTLTFNDCATVDAASDDNTIFTIGSADLYAGQQITLAWPCLVGITIGTCTGGIVCAAAWSVFLGTLKPDWGA